MSLAAEEHPLLEEVTRQHVKIVNKNISLCVTVNCEV
jgi:hypothetical protein